MVTQTNNQKVNQKVRVIINFPTVKIKRKNKQKYLIIGKKRVKLNDNINNEDLKKLVKQAFKYIRKLKVQNPTQTIVQQPIENQYTRDILRYIMNKQPDIFTRRERIIINKKIPDSFDIPNKDAEKPNRGNDNVKKEPLKPLVRAEEPEPEPVDTLFDDILIPPGNKDVENKDATGNKIMTEPTSKRPGLRANKPFKPWFPDNTESTGNSNANTEITGKRKWTDDDERQYKRLLLENYNIKKDGSFVIKHNNIQRQMPDFSIREIQNRYANGNRKDKRYANYISYESNRINPDTYVSENRNRDRDNSNSNRATNNNNNKSNDSLPDPTEVDTDDDEDQQGNGESSNTGLTNIEIDNIVTSNKKIKDYLKTLSIHDMNKIPTKTLQSHFKDNKTVSFIVNTEPYPKNGHWVSLRIDTSRPNEDIIEYYDSFGKSPSKQNKDRIIRFYNRIFPDNKKLVQFKVNAIIGQDVRTENCGWFAIKFIQDRNMNIPFKEATNFNLFEKYLNNADMGEQQIEKFKSQIKPFRTF